MRLCDYQCDAHSDQPMLDRATETVQYSTERMNLGTTKNKYDLGSVIQPI